MTNVHSPWQCAMELLLVPLIFGFVFAGASAFTATYSRRFGARGGTIVTAILRNLLGIPLLIIGYVWAWLIPSQWVFAPSGFTTSLGWILVTVGAAPLLVGHLYVGMRSHFPSVKDTLVRNGLYAYIRHPIYASYFLMSGGLFLVNPAVTTVAMVAYAFYDFLQAARREEKLMAGRLPGYDQYIAETPSFIPRFRKPLKP